MLTDMETNCVYFSDLVPTRHPELFRRLEETLAKSSAHGEPEKILQAIRDALDGFRDPAQPQDDETMMCLALDGLERKRPESAS